MAAAKVYFDEDVHPLIADALVLRGWEALTTVQAARLRSTDIEQIQFAASRGYVMFSYNIRDFPRLHFELLAAGEHHAGIIMATQEDPKRNAKTLLSLLDAFDATDFADQLLYLNNW